MNEITDHHDGYGLNESITIKALDEPGPGGAHHLYVAVIKAKNADGVEDEIEVARVQFQKGPRNEPGSTPGVTHMAMAALLLHPLRAFQEGPFKSRLNALVITALEEALNWMHARARDRAQRGVLGHLKP